MQRRGACGSVKAALRAVQSEVFDLAVLDVDLNGEKVYPVAEQLAERHIPFVFLSGYGQEAIPPNRLAWRVCAKPFKAEELARLLSDVLVAAPR